MVDADFLTEFPDVLLDYMRSQRKAVFHNSNIFLRDLQYCVQDYFEDTEGVTIKMPEAERIAKEIARACVAQGIFRKVNPQGYVLVQKDYITPKEGTAGLLNVRLEDLPPMVGSVAPTADAAPVGAAPAAAAPKAAAPKAAAPKAAAPAGDAPAAKVPAPQAAPAGGVADASGIPTGAKGKTPPWLVKK